MKCSLDWCIDRCTTPVQVTREEQGTWTSGRYDEGDTETFWVNNIHIQPMTEKEREQLPEAIRTKELVLCFSKEALRTDDVNLGTKADTFVFNDEVYVVNSVENWYAFGGFYRIIAEKANDGGV